jgi:hypothetical protein
VPRATVNTEATRHELKTCPGGFVDLRALPFGQMLERREKASKMSMEQSLSRSRQRSRDQQQTISFDLMQRWARSFEFKHCIVDHNLEDDKGQKLNFDLPGTLDILDPRIGSEIERYIDELNQEEEEELEDFMSASTPTYESETQSESTD